MPLVVAVDLVIYKIPAENRPTHSPGEALEAGKDGAEARRLWEMAVEANGEGTCCEKGFFIKNWTRKECSGCPKGHESKFGGLFCAPN